MSETPKITLEADYKKVDEKALTDANVDSKKLAEKAVTKEDHKKVFKTNFETMSGEKKLAEHCAALQGEDVEAKETAIDNINKSLNESFTIVEKTVDGKEMIAFKMNETDKEFTLIGKDDFHSLFTEMVKDLYKDCGGDEFKTEISGNKNEEFKLNDDIVIGGTELKNMKTQSENLPPSGSQVTDGNSGNKGSEGNEDDSRLGGLRNRLKDQKKYGPVGDYIKNGILSLAEAFKGFQQGIKEGFTQIKSLPSTISGLFANNTATTTPAADAQKAAAGNATATTVDAKNTTTT